MEMREHGNMLLRSIAELLKLEDPSQLAFDENNECFLTFDERIVLMVYFDDEINTIIINILLGVLPQDSSREEIMYELLCGNYCWNLTEGGTLGIDQDTAVISLSYPIQLPLDPPEVFIDIVTKLVNVADFWLKKLGEIGGDYAQNPNQNNGWPQTEHMIKI